MKPIVHASMLAAQVSEHVTAMSSIVRTPLAAASRVFRNNPSWRLLLNAINADLADILGGMPDRLAQLQQTLDAHLQACRSRRMANAKKPISSREKCVFSKQLDRIFDYNKHFTTSVSTKRAIRHAQYIEIPDLPILQSSSGRQPAGPTYACESKKILPPFPLAPATRSLA